MDFVEDKKIYDILGVLFRGTPTMNQWKHFDRTAVVSEDVV